MSWKKWICKVPAGVIVLCVTLVCVTGQPDVQAVTGKTVAAGKSSAGTTATAKRKVTAQDVMDFSVKKLEQVNSMQAGMVMDLGIEVIGIELGAQASIDMLSSQSPLQLQTVVGVDMGFLGANQAVTYGCETEGEYYLYRKNKDRWVKNQVKEAELARYNGKELILTWMEHIEEPKVVGVEQMDGQKAYRFTGVIGKEGLQAVLVDAGCLELLAEGFEGKLLSTVGSLLLQEDKIDALMQKAEDMPVEIWIDAQTGYPLQCTMDVGEMLNDSFGRLTGRITEKGSKSSRMDIWSGVEITKANIVINCGEFE